MAADKVDGAETVGLSGDAVSKLEEEESVISFGAILVMLRAGRKPIAISTLCSSLVAIAISFLIPLKYTSKASFIPPGSGGNSAGAALAGQLSQLSSLAPSSMLGAGKGSSELYVGILKSRSVASELVKRFDLVHVYKVKKESQAEKQLTDNSNFEVGVKDPIVTIAVVDVSPSRAQGIANAYLDVLRETNNRLALTEASQRRMFFGQQLAKEKDELANAEVDLKRTEEQTGLIAPAGQTASQIQASAQTRAAISVRQVELSALRQSATNQNPDVVRLQSEIADLQRQLASQHSGSEESLGNAIPTSKVPAIELEYVRKSREVKYHETLFEMLARQYESARLDEARDAPLLQILDSASYPDSKSGPARMLITLDGMLFGLLAGCAWVLVRDRLFATQSTKKSSVVST